VGSGTLMPTLPAVLGRVGQLVVSGAFWRDAWVSLQHFGLGYVPALIGIPLGIAFAAIPPLRFIFGALFNGLAAAPLIASAPLMTGWFGIGDTGKIALVFVVALVALASEVMTGFSPNAADKAPGTARCIVASLRRSFVLAVTAMLVASSSPRRTGSATCW
jgi:NitT/TauT family transport system permease protein